MKSWYFQLWNYRILLKRKIINSFLLSHQKNRAERKAKYRRRYRTARMESDDLPVFRMGLYIRCLGTWREELRESGLFPRHLSLHHHDKLADQSGYSGRCHKRDHFLHKTKLGEAIRCTRLVRGCYTVFLFTVGLLRWCCHVLVVQWLQT